MTTEQTDTELRAEFVQQLTEKMRAGAIEYGNESFYRPLAVSEEEILAELVDVAGWSCVMWIQMRRRLQGVVLAAENLPDLTPPRRPRLILDQVDVCANWRTLAILILIFEAIRIAIL